MTGETAQSSENNESNPSADDVEAMYQLISNIDPVIRPLIPMFLEQSLLRISSLEEARGGSDFVAIRKLAHTMKGSASSYGFTAMASVSRDIEDVLRNEPVDTGMLENKIRRLLEMHNSALSVVKNNPALFEDE